MITTKAGRRIRSRRWIACLALAAVGSMAVAGCGGSSAASSSGQSDPSTNMTLKVGVIGPSADLTPFFAAEYGGFFKKAGVNVEVTPLNGGGASSVAALASGSVDVAMGGPTNFIGDIAKKVISGKLFAQVEGPNYDVLAAKDIASIAQLKGKVIGVSGAASADQIYLQAVLSHYGIQPSQVTFLTAGTPPERLATISTGRIQATAYANTERGIENKVGHILLASERSPISVPGLVFWADSKAISTQGNALKRFVQAFTTATAWVKDPANEKTAVQYCVRGSGATAASCEETIKFSSDKSLAGPWTWSSTAGLDTSGVAQAIKATAAVIPEAKTVTVSDVADTSFAGDKP